MPDPEPREIPLQPYVWSPRVIFCCLGAVILTLGVLVVVGIAFDLMQREVDAPLLLLGSLFGAWFGARYWAAGPALQLVLHADRIVVLHARTRHEVARAALADVRCVHGDYVVSARGGSGKQPALALGWPGFRELRIGPPGLKVVYYWKGDDPWARRWEAGKVLSMPTHLAPDFGWVDLVNALGVGDELVVHPLPGA
jgi:hypothetical protein